MYRDRVTEQRRYEAYKHADRAVARDNDEKTKTFRYRCTKRNDTEISGPCAKGNAVAIGKTHERLSIRGNNLKNKR